MTSHISERSSKRNRTLASTQQLDLKLQVTQPHQTTSFEPFSCLAPHRKHDQEAQFLAITIDICEGIEACLEIVYSSDLARELGIPPLLEPDDTGRLQRLASASVHLLSDAAKGRVNWLNENESKGI